MLFVLSDSMFFEIFQRYPSSWEYSIYNKYYNIIFDAGYKQFLEKNTNFSL